VQASTFLGRLPYQ
jgi:hypothetical protein